MLLTYKIGTPVAMVVFGLLALSSSGVMVGALWLVLGVLVLPALALTLITAKRRAAPGGASAVRTLAASDVADRSRLDRDTE